jgi:hypothetical protein
MANIPTLYEYLKQKKVGGCLDLIFGLGDFRSDYLGEYDAICKTVLACLSGTNMGLIDEKIRKVENLVLLSL